MDNFVIAAAQSASVRGDIAENVSRHLGFIRLAAAAGANLIVFPELSLTGYEPDLSRELQMEWNGPKLGPLREAACTHDVNVLVGGPWVSGRDKPFLGAFLLSPERSRAYAKVHVHASEEPYFVAGEDRCVVTVDGVRTGFAICADTSHPTHAADAAARGAELYAAAVMKTEAEFPAHEANQREYATRHRMAVLTANYAGSTGGADSAGRSACWNERGEPVAQANSNDEALVVARRVGGEWHGEVITDF